MGGLERVLVSLANTLCTMYEVHVISLSSSSDAPFFALDSRVNVHMIRQGEARIRQLITGCFRPLIRYINTNKIDIAFIMGNYPIPVVLPIKPFVSAKLIYCDHGALKNQLDSKAVLTFRRMAARHAHKVIALTQQNRDAYIELFHMKPEKVDYIYNWIDDSVLTQAGQYNKDSKCILSVGRFGEEKGYDLLLKVAPAVFERHPDWQWHIYGDGETFETIRQGIIDLHLQQNIRLMGTTNKMYSLYKNYGIFVLPSYREGLPLALLEARANAIPCVSFDIVTGPREILRPDKDGFLIKAYDTKEMAQRINFLIEHEDERVRMAQHAKEGIVPFSKDAILRKWIDTIDNL